MLRVKDLSVIDTFMTAFTTYIDSGFGLLGPDVKFLTTILIGIDITLAGLFWAMGGEDVIGRFLRKILFVGAFAFIIGSFASLAEIIFKSFAQAGLTAGGGAMTPADLMKPGVVASTGFSAAWPLVEQASELMGFTSFFDNFLTIAVLLFAWVLVIIAFFILAVQMFVTIIEFKLTTLAGFILVPFALWNRTGFLAERVLGNVVSSGIKVMVLAVILGIGSTFFSEFTAALGGSEPDIGMAMSLVLASLALLGLGIFGPSIASGLISGGPQLGAGAAFGTSLGAAGVAGLGGAAMVGGARVVGGGALGAIRAGTAMGAATSSAYQLGQQSAGSTSVASGVGGVARAAGNAVRSRASAALGFSQAVASGRQSAWNALNSNSSPSASGGGETAPAWARALRSEEAARHHRQAAVHSLQQGASGGASANPDIKERED
jgi:type IV secretion system protein TrbL